MASLAKLYTPGVLALATGLAGFRWDPTLPLQGEARSKSCGSTITLGLGLDASGRIDRMGLRSQACAIGQAAAAIFAQAAIGRDAGDIRAADEAIAAWLTGEGELPEWPGFAEIEAARDYPARHGAIRLAWTAARQLLPTDDMPR